MKKTMDSILKEHEGAGKDHLIPILQEIQEADGFLSVESVTRVGQHLDMPASKIFGVATFYNQFRFEPLGRYHIQVCRGTACHVLGSATVLDELRKILQINAGQTTRDGLFSLEVVACIGACGLAPVIAVNGEFHAKVDATGIRRVIEEYRNNGTETE